MSFGIQLWDTGAARFSTAVNHKLFGDASFVLATTEEQASYGRVASAEETPTHPQGHCSRVSVPSHLTDMGRDSLSGLGIPMMARNTNVRKQPLPACRGRVLRGDP